MRQIIQIPNPILYEVSKPVKVVDDYIMGLVEDMKYHINLPNSASISAVQLGEKVRLIGIKYGQEIIFIVNPAVVKKSKQMCPSVEGCLSIGNGKIPYLVPRYKIVKVKGLGLDLKEVTYKGRDIFGHALQHEIDHTNGHLISDKGRRLR